MRRRKGKTPTKREHSEVWTLTEERTKSFPTGWLEIEHVLGHATEDMVRQGRALEEHRLANNYVDLLRGSQWWTTAGADRSVRGKSGEDQKAEGNCD